MKNRKKSESPDGNNKHIYTKSQFAYSTIVIKFHQTKFNINKNEFQINYLYPSSQI